MKDLLVLYYSNTGAVREMANYLARGIERVPGARARVRTVPKLSTVTEAIAPPVPDSGAPYAELKDFDECSVDMNSR